MTDASCDRPVAIADFLLGQLSPDETERARLHLASCLECAAQLEGLHGREAQPARRARSIVVLTVGAAAVLALGAWLLRAEPVVAVPPPPTRPAPMVTAPEPPPPQIDVAARKARFTTPAAPGCQHLKYIVDLDGKTAHEGAAH